MKYLLLLIVIVFSGCGDKKKNNSSKSQDKNSVVNKSELPKDQITLTNSKLTKGSKFLTLPKKKPASDKAFKKNFLVTFDQKGPWHVEDNNKFTFSVKNGYYNMEFKEDSTRDTYVPMALGEGPDDFAFESKIEHINGKVYYGILIGHSKAGAYYLLINPSIGGIQFLELKDNKFSTFVKDEGNAAVNNKVNTLRFERVGKMQRVFLNGMFLWEIPATPRYGDKFGFTCQGKASIKADYVKMSW